MATSSNQFGFDFDAASIVSPRRTRRRIAETSVDAHERNRRNPMAVTRDDALKAVKQSGKCGLTLLEFVAQVNRERRTQGVRVEISPNDVSGRFTELGDEQKIYRVMREDKPEKRLTRDGAGVWRAVEVIQ